MVLKATPRIPRGGSSAFFTSLVAVFNLLHLSDESTTGLNENYPQILIQDGHLECIGVEDRNISLRTSGGFVNLNGENMAKVLSAAKEASEVLETIKANSLSTLQDEVSELKAAVEGPQGIDQKIVRLEGHFANISTIGGDSYEASKIVRRPWNFNSKLTTMTRSTNRIENMLLNLQHLLTTNECSSSPCLHGALCVDVFNDVICRCPPNWEGKYCETDVNECDRFIGTDLGCQNGATCVNMPGSYECSCSSGYYGMHCTQKGNNCSSASAQELCGHGVCVSHNGGYACICDQGWKAEERSGPSCTLDVNECSGNIPACSHDPPVPCINVPGSFYCGACPQGYSGNGYYCSDINECLVRNGGCSINPYVSCINIKGSRICGPCPPGYEGDGTSCVYRGVCQINNGGCHPIARCIQNPSISQTYVECLCPSGFSGNGLGPGGCQPTSGGVILADPCVSQPCLNGGSCVSISHFSITCHCHAMFTGLHCENIIDPCQSAPCLNGGTCRSFTNATGYSCQCTQDYTGDHCQTQQQACGGTLSGLSGILLYPPGGNSKYRHNTNCAWLIVTNETKILNVTFTKFNLEASTPCQHDWLQIHDGHGAGSDHIIGRFCGSNLPKGGNIISSHNVLYFWFRSDHNIADEGFELTWNSIPPVCGGILERETHGTVQSPGSPGKYPPNRDCFWVLSVPMGKRIQIHFFKLQIEAQINCNNDYLEVRDGSQDNSPLLGRYCNSTVPVPLTTSGHFALLHFHSNEDVTDYGFQLSFSAEPGIPGCGGLFTSPSGILSSPNHQDNYRNNINCEWLIRLPTGNRIKITFLIFSLEDSNICSFDYLELRDGGGETSPLIARLCGDTLPRPYLSTGNNMFLQFKSDSSVTSGGFQLRYDTLCGGEYSDQSGVFHSPYYPDAYPASKLCIYHILVPPGNIIQLEFQDFDLTSYCNLDYVQVYDGNSENSPLIGTYCGNEEKIPLPIISSFNHLWIKFWTDVSVNKRGFMANYTSIKKDCGGIHVSPSGFIEYSINIFQNHVAYSIQCMWMIEAEPGQVVQLTWETFSFAYTENCELEYVKVYDGRSINEDAIMGTYCTRNLPPILKTMENVMTIVVNSSFIFSDSRFSAQYLIMDASRVCGGTYFTTTGVISTPNYPRAYPHHRDCVWVINVPNGQQIMLNVTAFDLEKNHQCSYDYLEIRNGGYSTSPLIGKFCGDTIQRGIRSSSNQLYLHFVSDLSNSGSGFKILWDGTTTGCGGRLTGTSGSIISPNYPQYYGNNAECFWKILVNKGSKIQLIIVDLDIEDHSNCFSDYLEIRDGNDVTGKLLGKFCRENQRLFFISTSNHMWVKFRSHNSVGGRGFHLKYKAECNSELKGYRGVVESPNFPEPYWGAINCTWIIVAPMGNKLNISFSHFELASPVNSNCSDDYVKIIDGEDRESPTEVLGKYCGNELPQPIYSKFNHMFINLVISNPLNYNGFRLEWVVNGCGGLYEHPFGHFTTPGYPNGYPRSTTCEWYIRTELGTSVELTIQSYDLESGNNCQFDFIKIYGGPDESSPLLGNLCDKKTNVTLYTSSGNNMFVKFQSDHSLQGKGFTASYINVPSDCGGKFISNFGSIHSRNYPHNYEDTDDCFWSIEVDKNHIIRLIFITFQIEAHNNCSADYVNVFDGDTEQHPLLLNHCGNELPKPNEIYSTGNKMLLRMKTDESITSKGFLANYTMHCGAHIYAEEDGELSFSNIVHTFGSNISSCTWVIEGTSPDTHITLTFTHMDILPIFEENEDDCPYIFIEVRDGTDKNSPLIGKYCSSKIPPHITSTGSALYVHYFAKYFVNKGHFAAFYSILHSACGGKLTSEHGTFTTPGVPGTYPLNVECVWIINSSPGNRAMLSFRSFDLEFSDSCDKDYVEVRDGNSTGTLIGVYCGDSIPNNVTASQMFWIKFRSDDAGISQGFIADYSMLHGNELSGVEGQISSPLYPHPYINQGIFKWRITVGLGKVVFITFNDFFMESYVVDSCSTSDSILQIYDGYDETAPILLNGCGADLPPPLISTSNVVYIVCTLSRAVLGSYFLLSWNQMVSSRYSTPSTSGSIQPTSITCGESIYIGSIMTQFSSPGYPNGYDHNLNCVWLIRTSSANHIVLQINDMNLQLARHCIYDYLEVYKVAENDEGWELLKKYCLRNSTYENPLHGNAMMKVVFHTDYFRNGTGFLATVHSECGGSLSGSNGEIDMYVTIPNESYLNNMTGECEWNITVRRGKKVKVIFDVFDLTFAEDPACRFSYVLFKNGGSSNSPLLGNGKYCGSTIPQIPETVGNHMYIKYRNVYGRKGFKLRYMEESLSCGGQIILSSISNSYNFSSPNFPQIPPPHVECEWIILVPEGERINIEFLERFDLTYSYGCEKAYVEIREGGNQYSPLINRFCQDMPGTQTTVGNVMYVKFFTDVSDPKSGFKAEVSIATCGGTIRLYGIWHTLKSPNYPFHYSNNLVCEWTIKSHFHDYIEITFDDIDLPDDVNCSRTDHLTIIEEEPGFSNAGAGTTTTQSTTDVPSFQHFGFEMPALAPLNKRHKLTVLCGKFIPQPMTISSSEVRILFQSHHDMLKFKGFTITLKPIHKNCSTLVDGSTSGVIESPGYPSGIFENQLCSWTLSVPQGRRIRFEFTDLDIAGSHFHCTECIFFTNSNTDDYPFKYFCGTDEPEVVESLTNKMVVNFFRFVPSNHRGFRGTYSSNLQTLCEGDLNSSPGILTSQRLLSQSHFYCEWNYDHSSVMNFTFAFTLFDSQISNMSEDVCSYSSSKLVITGGDEIIRYIFCGNYTTPQIALNPYRSTKIVASQYLNMAGINNFTLKYSKHECGGVLEGPHETITSPNFPQEYPTSTECAWAINYPEGQQIRLKFLNIDLEVDCDHNFVSIRNGHTPESPLIGKYCGNVIPSDIISQTNHLWIRFHSNLQKQHTGFKLITEPIIGGCGGIFHANNGEISSPNYPQQYPNNAECVWELTVQDGYHIALTFTGRFQLEGGEDCNKDYIEILDYLNNNWISMEKICGRNLPRNFNSTGRQMKIIFRSNEAIQGDGFIAEWNVLCGGVITRKRGNIISPGYPQKYEKNMRCEYNISTPGGYIIAEFLEFRLENGASNCQYDNLTMYVDHKTSRATRTSVLGPFCGLTKPPAVKTFDNLRIVFQTDDSSEFKGFFLKYQVERCGGYLNEPGIIQSPNQNVFGHTQLNNCTWIIEAPENQVVSLVFEYFHIRRNFGCILESVSIYDGPMINHTNRMAQFCGNMDTRPPVIKSTTRYIVVESILVTGQFYITTDSPGFRAAVSFSYGEQSGCGGTMMINSSNPLSLHSPDILENDNLYEPFLDCHWVLLGPPQEILKLEFKAMDITPCNITSNSSSAATCNCDFIEVRDGAGPFSELIGKYCGNIENVPPIITSSVNMLWLRFVSDSSGNGHGFHLNIKSISSPCGPLTLNVNEIAQVLTSPNYPNNYTSNLYCQWLLTSPPGKRIELHIVDLELEDSKNCENDWLQIFDITQGDLITDGYSNAFIHQGTNNFHPFLKKNLLKSKFCGTKNPSDFYSGTSNVKVSFVTNNDISGHGFKIEYQISGCNRNFTAKQGRIFYRKLYGNDQSVCYTTVEAQPNSTVSLYFNQFFLVPSEGCSNSGMEVHDGLTENSPIIATLCGLRLPNSIFSNSSAIFIKTWAVREHLWLYYDITYTTTDRGRGCGGQLFNYEGSFTNPPLLLNVMNISCRWEIMVPESFYVFLKFKEFDLGLVRSCETTYLEILDVDKTTNTEVFRAKYCGMDYPVNYLGTSNLVIVNYVTNINNSGREWVIEFSAKSETGSFLTRD